MARPLRILFEDACYHVMNKGSGDSYLFLEEKDNQTFLKTTQEACKLFNVRVLAYCLMNTHYHLLVQTPDANLPRFMRHINGVFTQRRNQKYKTSGTIFKGRYLAIVVYEEEYLLRCVRYIHLNPLEAKIVKKAESYPWSSHKDYLKEKDVGSWLCVSMVLRRFDENSRKAVQKYKGFLRAGNDEITRNFYKRERPPSIFGSKEFTDDIKEKYIHADRVYDYREVPEAKRIQNERMVKEIMRCLCAEFEIKKERLYASVRKEGNLPRQMAVVLTKELTQLNNNEIARIYRIGTYKAVSAHWYRFKEKMKKDSHLAGRYEQIRKKCEERDGKVSVQGNCSQVET